MPTHPGIFKQAALGALLLMVISLPATGQIFPSTRSAAHRVAIHVDDNDPKVMNLALNNAKNVLEYYKAKGETVAIEVVAYGPGLHMLRADTSPVKHRVAEMSMAPEIAFSACGNTRANMAKQEGNDVSLLSEARLVPSGVVRLMELQKQGYAYIRPSGR
jgi:intracellular sulfur oxidation DsrE/DsrF family protein